MTSDPRWQPNGNQPPTWEDTALSRSTLRGVSVQRLVSGRRGSGLIKAATWLLALLAVGLFVVSLAAQYRYIFAEKHQALPAMIEAVGLDVGMAIFSLLALGLAMAGQSARVERALILACAAGSALMNYAAANGGSPRSVAAYVMPPIFLAIVVDRVVAVVRRHVLGDDDRSAWGALGKVALYGLRFGLDPFTTFFGLRRQVLLMAPVPGKPVAAVAAAQPVAELPSSEQVEQLDDGPVEQLDDADCPRCGRPLSLHVDPPEADQPERPGRHSRNGEPSKTSRFLQLVQDRHGPLAAIDPANVSRIATDLAPEVDLNPGSARSVLRPLVLAAQNGHSS